MLYCLLLALSPIIITPLTISCLATGDSILYRYKKNDKALHDNTALVIVEEFKSSLEVPIVLVKLYQQRVDEQRRNRDQVLSDKKNM